MLDITIINMKNSLGTSKRIYSLTTEQVMGSWIYLCLAILKKYGVLYQVTNFDPLKGVSSTPVIFIGELSLPSRERVLSQF